MALSTVSALCLTSASSTAGVSVMNFRRYSQHKALVYACSARNAEARVLPAVAVEEVESTSLLAQFGINRCRLSGTHSGVPRP